MEAVTGTSGPIAGIQSTIIPQETQQPCQISTSNPKVVRAFILATTKWRRANTKKLADSRRSYLSRLVLGLCSCQWSAALSYEKRRSLVDADAVLRRYTLQMAILSSIGTVLVVAHNDVCFNAETLEFYNTSHACPLGAQLLWLNIVVSAVFVHRLILYYHCRSYIQMKEWHLPTRWRAFFEARLSYFFTFELVIAIWQPIPGLQHIFGLGHKVVITLMVFRLYLLVRLLRDFSPAHIHRRRIKSEYEHENHGYRADIRVDTVLKTQFYSHTQITIFSTFLIMAVSMAYVIYILERQLWVPQDGGRAIPGSEWVLLSPLQRDFYKKTVMADYSNCIWFVTVTATTVGYGDITPYTGPARVAAMTSAMGGIITTSLLVSVLTNRLAPTPFQQYVIDYLNRSTIRSRKREIAAIVIQTWWRTIRAGRKPRIGTTEARRSSLLTNVALSNMALSNMTKFHSALIELDSLNSREAHMKSNGPHDVTDFNGLTRAILAEQLEMKKTMHEIQETVQRLSNELAASGANTFVDKVEEISIPVVKEDRALRNRKRGDSSSSEDPHDLYFFKKI